MNVLGFDQFLQIFVGCLVLLTTGMGVGALLVYVLVVVPWKRRCLWAEDQVWKEIERR